MNLINNKNELINDIKKIELDFYENNYIINKEIIKKLYYFQINYKNAKF